MNSYVIERKICPGCAANHGKSIYSLPYNGKILKKFFEEFYHGNAEIEILENDVYELMECIECGLIYQKFIPNQELMGKIYDSWINPELAKSNHQKKDTLELFSFFSNEISTLISLIDKSPSELNFLDYGMGWAKWSQMAKGYGVNSFGFDFSASRKENAVKQGIVVLDYEKIPEYKFDYINTEQVFEHLDKPKEILEHLVKALKPKGIIKISVPNGKNLKKKLEIADWEAEKFSANCLNPVSPLEHINCFTKESLIAFGKQSGLERIKIPMKIQFANSAPGMGFKNMISSWIKPIYRNTISKNTYLFFKKVP